jgi:hypothetical protein
MPHALDGRQERYRCDRPALPRAVPHERPDSEDVHLARGGSASEADRALASVHVPHAALESARLSSSGGLASRATRVCAQVPRCSVAEIPPLIGSFYLLRTLDLSENDLTELPPDIGNCFSLQSLNVSCNRIKSFPDELGQLKVLTTFLLYANHVTVLPDWVGNMPLTELNAFNNRILKLPAGLGALRDCKEMNLAANVIMQLTPQSIESWKAVTVLNLYARRDTTRAHLTRRESTVLPTCARACPAHAPSTSPWPSPPTSPWPSPPTAH